MENFGSVVLEAFLAGQKSKREREQLAQAKLIGDEKLKLEQDQQRIQQQQFGEHLKLQKDQFQTEQQLRAASHKLQETIARSAMSYRNMQGAGDGLGNVTKDEQTGDYNITPFSTPQQIGQARATIQAPVLDAQAEKTMKIASNQGAISAANATTLQKQKAGDAITLAGVNNTAADRRAAQKNANSIRTAEIAANSRILVANKNLAAGKPSADELKQDIDGVADGLITMQTLKELGTDATGKTELMRAARQKGFRILSIQDHKDLNNLGEFGIVYSLALEYNQALKSKNVSEIVRLESQLESTLGKLATTIGNEKGALSLADINRQRGNIPSKMGAVLGNNDKKLETLFRFYQNKVNTSMRGMNDEQKVRLSRTFNLIGPPLPTDAPRKIPREQQ